MILALSLMGCILGWRQDRVDSRRVEIHRLLTELDTPENDKNHNPCVSPQEKRIIHQTMPDFAMSDDTWWARFFHEVGRRHQWLSVALVYHRYYPRVIRVTIITSAVFLVMFANALLYS